MKKRKELENEIRRLNRTVNRLRRELENAEERARTDALTGLANRRVLLEDFPDEKRQGVSKYLGIIYIDVDNFSAVNNLLGHTKGDNVLKKLGQIILQNTRATDVPIRLGGDEIIIFLPGSAIETVKTLASLIERKFHTYADRAINRHIQDSQYHTSLSIGCSYGNNVPKIMAEAEEQMYRHKYSKRETAHE